MIRAWKPTQRSPDLAVDREPMGSLELSAHTVNRDLVYDATSRMEAAELTLHGQTELRGDYQTQARLDFSRFNIGAVFRLAHLEAHQGRIGSVGHGDHSRPAGARG